MIKKIFKIIGSLVLVLVLYFAGNIGWQLFQQRELPAVPEDLAILEQTKAILSEESKWDKNDDRKCSSTDTTFSLFCALQKASIEVTGEYKHRRASLQAVRISIEEVAGKDFEHRLMDFNNLTTTTLEDVWQVIELAHEKVEVELAKQ